MANRKIYPHELGAAFMADLGLNYAEIANTRDGIQQAQLSLITKSAFSVELKSTAYKLTKHVNDWARIKADKTDSKISGEIDQYGKYMDQQLTSTATAAIMGDMVNQAPDQKVKWLPSSANEQDVTHALQYGRTMTLERAQELGLGTRPGCQCGVEILNDDGTIET